VIEVHNAQHAAQLLSQFQQEMQQGDRIRTAGNSNAQALSGAKQIGVAEQSQEPLGELISPGHSFSLRSFLR
jgi:hypothetical protein